MEDWKLTTDRHEASRGLFATAELLIFDKKKANCMAIWHAFEKDAAEYFERSHQVFDNRKAERAVKCDSHTAVN